MSIAPAPARSGEGAAGVIGAGAWRTAGRWFRSPRWALACASLTLAFLGAATYSVSATPPLVMHLTGLQTAGRSRRIHRLTMQVTNRSGAAVRPVFAVLQTPNTTFWKVQTGPSRLASGQAADYTLLGPGAEFEPTDKATFSVLAFIASPASIAVSDEYDEALSRRGTRHRERGTHNLDIRFGGR